MLPTSHFNSVAEDSDLSTYFIIPFDSLKNPDELARLKISLDDTLYILPQNQVQDKPSSSQIDDIVPHAQIDQTCVQTSLLTNPALPNTVHEKQEVIVCSEPKTDLRRILKSASEVKYKCIKCDISLNSVKEYKTHLKRHKTQKKYKCSSCSSGYNIESNLKIHNALVHPKGTIKSCPICGVSLTFQRAASLKSHLLVHLVEELQECEECNAEIDKEEEFAQHMITHATKNKINQSSLICSHCDIEFKSNQELKMHMSEHSRAWKFFGKKKVKKTILKDKRYNCKVCSKSFIKRSLLERHERIHSGDKPYKCIICDQSFTQKGTLQIHLMRHTGSKPFACTLCSARFNQKGNLRAHINKTHTAPNEGQKMFKCPHCSCIFKRIASLNGHVTKAHLKYRFTEENVIGNVMRNLKDLKEQTFDSYVTLTESTEDNNGEKKFVVQMKKMGDVKWYKCSYCSKMCKKPSDLIRHIRVHTREKPFVCKICKKSFSLKSTLFCHMNTHNRAISIKCINCDSIFSSYKMLNLHIRKHANEKLSKWQCVTCGILFDEFESALQHKMTQEQPHTIQSIVTNVIKQSISETGNDNSPQKPKNVIPNTENEVSVLKPFHCTLCDARFTLKKYLNRHLRHHETNNRRFNCHHCPKMFLTSYKLNEHLNTLHNIKNYACKVCNKRFGSSRNLNRHKVVVNHHHDSQRPYTCPYCSKRFPTLVLGSRHIRNVHKRGILPEIELGISPDTNKSDVLSQATSVIKTNSKSPKSDANSNSNTEIGTFQQTIPEERSQETESLNPMPLQEPNTELQTFYVNLDDLQLMSNSEINLSALLENPGNNENYQATIDEITEKCQNQENPVVMYTNFTQPTNTLDVATLESAEAVFDGNTVVQTSVGFNETRNIFDDASIICMNCNKMFASFVHFQMHNCNNKDQIVTEIPPQKTEQVPNVEIKSVPDQLEKQFECTICDKIFRNKKKLRVHTKTHSCVRCIKCKQVFTGKAAYLKHAATHTSAIEAGSYHCLYCLKAFKKPSDLERHIRTHTGEKPFACEKCDKKFSLKSTLMSHIRTHDPNHKQFGCAICNAFFSSKSSLKVHMTIHTGQLLYFCSVCQAQFRTLGAKNAHEAVGHPQHPKKKVKKSTKSTLTDILQTLSSDIVSEKTKEDEMHNNNLPEFVPLETLGLVVTQDNLSAQPQTLDLPSQIVSLDIPPETILSTIPEDQISVDPSNLLQQLQMSDMVLTTNETETVPSLILDDVSFLDLNSASNNLQIISLPEQDGRVTISIRENVEMSESTEKPKPAMEKPKAIECDICHKTYASKDGLRKHKKNVHGTKKFRCKKCAVIFDSKEELREHEKEHCLCVVCSQKFDGEKTLKKHVQSCHQMDDDAKEETSALLNLKLDLPSGTIDEPLFNNLFFLKK